MPPKPLPPDTNLIIQPGYASGDQFGIAAKLANDPKSNVLVFQKHDKPSSFQIEAFYREVLPKDKYPNRVFTMEVDSEDDYYNTNALKKLAEDNFAQQNPDFTKTFKPVDLAAGTDFVAGQWSTKARENVRERWGLEKKGSQKNEQVQEWLTGKGLPEVAIADKKVAVLWSRFSGKKGGAHPEHDTSHEGMRQIVNELKQSFDAIIIVGDRHPKHPKPANGEQPENDPWTQLQDLDPEAKCKVLDLTEFWKNDKNELEPWGGDSRIGQFQLYDHLNAQSQGLVHLGFRSGNLEAMALMGHKVGYMEQKHSKGGPRMDAWQRAKPKGLNYDKILLDQVPTRTGRQLTSEHIMEVLPVGKAAPYVQHSLPTKLDSYPNSDPERHQDHKSYKEKSSIPLFDSGFTHTDLRSIVGFAQTSVLETALQKMATDHHLPADALLKPTETRKREPILLPRAQESDSDDKIQQKAEAAMQTEALQVGLLTQLQKQLTNVNQQLADFDNWEKPPLIEHLEEMTELSTKLRECKAEIHNLRKQESALRKTLDIHASAEPQEDEERRSEITQMLQETTQTLDAKNMQRGQIHKDLLIARQETLQKFGGQREFKRALNHPLLLEQKDLAWAKQTREKEQAVLTEKITDLKGALAKTQELKVEVGGLSQIRGLGALPPPMPKPATSSVADMSKLAKRQVDRGDPLAEIKARLQAQLAPGAQKGPVVLHQ